MATLKEVAQAAGVSAATASRALRGVDLISEQTRIKVIDTAKRMNFSLSRSASQLASGRTMRVVTLFNGPLNTWFNASCLEGSRYCCHSRIYPTIFSRFTQRTQC